MGNRPGDDRGEVGGDGLVRKAAAQVPVADVPAFITPLEGIFGLGTSWDAAAEQLSPNRYPSKKPILVYATNQDTTTAPATRVWIRSDPKVHGRWRHGGHLEDPYRDSAMRRALTG